MKKRINLAHYFLATACLIISILLIPEHVTAETVLIPHVLSDGTQKDISCEKNYHFTSDGKQLFRLDVPQNGAVKIRLAAEKSTFVVAEVYTDAEASGLPHYLKADCKTDLWSTGSMMEYFAKGTYYLRFPENTYTAGIIEYPCQNITLKNGVSVAGYCDYEHSNSYTFKAPGNGYIMIGKTGMEKTPGTMTTVLCNSKGKELTERSLFAMEQGYNASYAVKKGITYKIKIGALNVNDTQYYRLNLKYAGVNEKSGSSKKKSVEVKFGNRVSGTIFAEDSTSKADWYKINNITKQKLILSYSGNITSGSLIFDVYDAKGKKLDRLSIISNIEENKETFLHNSKGGEEMPKGTYYVKVTKSGKTSTGIYSFSLAGK